MKILQIKKSFWVLFVLSLAGCASIKPPDVRVQPASQYQLFQEKEGLKISIDPFLDEDKVKKFFGVDLLAEGILPVLVIAENYNTKNSYFLQKDNFLLELAIDESAALSSQGVELSELKRQQEEIESAGERWREIAQAHGRPPLTPGSLEVNAVLAITGAIILYDKIATDRKMEVFKHNFIEKELMDKTLYPGRSHHGFIYFELQNVAVNSTSAISIKAKNLQNNEVLTFRFIISQGEN